VERWHAGGRTQDSPDRRMINLKLLLYSGIDRRNANFRRNSQIGLPNTVWNGYHAECFRWC